MSSARLAAKAGLSASCLEGRSQPETRSKRRCQLSEDSKPEGLGLVYTARLPRIAWNLFYAVLQRSLRVQAFQGIEPHCYLGLPTLPRQCLPVESIATA